MHKSIFRLNLIFCRVCYIFYLYWSLFRLAFFAICYFIPIMFTYLIYWLCRSVCNIYKKFYKLFGQWFGNLGPFWMPGKPNKNVLKKLTGHITCKFWKGVWPTDFKWVSILGYGSLHLWRERRTEVIFEHNCPLKPKNEKTIECIIMSAAFPLPSRIIYSSSYCNNI